MPVRHDDENVVADEAHVRLGGVAVHLDGRRCVVALRDVDDGGRGFGVGWGARVVAGIRFRHVEDGQVTRHDPIVVLIAAAVIGFRHDVHPRQRPGGPMRMIPVVVDHPLVVVPKNVLRILRHLRMKDFNVDPPS